MSLTAVVFVLAFAAGSILALGRHPIYGLITYVAVFYVHPPARWWGQGLLLDVRWSLIAAGVTLLALIVHRSKDQTVPVFRSGAFWGLVLFVVWIAFQSFWALDGEAHSEFLLIYLKFIIVIGMVCLCITNEAHLRWFLWAHVLGCFYLGWLAYLSFTGGRLDGVGGPGINEANAAALQMATGILVAGSLFLAARKYTRVGLLFLIPFMVNGLVTTISRSGFLALAAGGIIYNLFAPKRFGRNVRIFSTLALVMFGLIAHESYWDRITTIKYQGQDIEGVDTGGGRLKILQVQWQMFEKNPLGCGHMCTTVLSPLYLEERFLSGGARASHNTFMTMLVDHGIIGGVFYVAMLTWIFLKLRIVARRLKDDDGFLATVLPAVAGALGAITIADMFVQYPKFEARIWFIALVIVLLHLTGRKVREGRTD